MPDINPLPNQLFIRKCARETHYGSGIVEMAQKYQKAAHEGEVIAVGDLNYKGIQVGDSILFASYAEQESFDWGDDGDYITVIKESEILAYWHGEK